MPADVLLGADVGTSGLKLVAMALEGNVVAEAEVAYPVDAPRPGWAQTPVIAWRRAVEDALGQLAPALAGRAVRGLGLSGQMHGAVLVDAAGSPLAPALLWPDTRAGAEVARWRALPAADRAALANPLVPGMTGPLLAWLAGHEPALVERAAGVLLPKDAVRAALVPDADPRVTDRSDASATLLWDVPADAWTARAAELTGLPGRLLPAVRPSAEVVGTTVLPATGSGAEVPVVVGGADTPLAMLAAGVRDGLQVNLGTGAQVLRPGAVPAPADDPVTHLYADVEGGWYAMAALRNAGSAWTWVGSVLGLSDAEFFAAAESSPAGAGGVRFAPFLSGERGGVAGPGDRGAWTGLSPGTTRADLARAAVEGVLGAVAASAALLAPAHGGRDGGRDGGHDDGHDDGPVVLTGGGGRAGVVRTVLAGVLEREVVHLPLRSASAVGAAMLAARGVGLELPLSAAR